MEGVFMPKTSAHIPRKEKYPEAPKMKMKEIHKPSSFEGAVWVAQGIKDARMIFHAPPGCYMMQHMYALCNEWHPDFYSTSVSYGNVMQGTEAQLEKILKKVVAEDPKAIIIVTSPVIEITGDDVEGVAHKVGFDKTIIIRPPIGSSLAEGKEKAFLSLVELMDPKVERLEKTVNLIGPTYNTFNWRADVFELKRMLSALGVRVNTVFTADSTVGEIESAPCAHLNVCIYPYDCGIEMAKKMEECFAIPYLANHVPLGFRESAAWIEEIARFFKIDAKAYLKQEMEQGFDLVTSLLVSNTFFESSVALSTDNCDSYSVGISSFLKRELGMEICLATAAHDRAAEKMREVCSTVLVNPGIDEKKNLFLEKSPTIILGNFYDLKLSTDLGFKNFLFADIPLIGYIFSESTPFMGFMGAQHLIQSMGNEIYTKIFIESKGEMEGVISSGEVPWELDAERALGKIAQLTPHFIRSIAIKKIHQVADEIALERKSKVTLAILREVANKYTPTRFKAKYSTLFADMDKREEDEEIETLVFQMEWEQEAKEMLKMVPAEFKVQAVSGTEEYAKKHHNTRITTQVVEAYRKELGF
jgi:light-independent protochlorophyllide reductase B subunit